jgi:hypothetical protein
MIGRSALWVAQQHGHSIETMLRIYAAWTPGAVDADLATIERAMISTPRRGFSKERERFPPSQNPLEWALDWSMGDPAKAASVGALRRYLAEREGFEPDSATSANQQVTDSENNSVPIDPQKSP